jgi:hypothetical protein
VTGSEKVLLLSALQNFFTFSLFHLFTLFPAKQAEILQFQRVGNNSAFVQMV